MSPQAEIADPPTLLSVIELLGYPNQRVIYEGLGYRVLTEFSVRKAIGLMRKEKPAVIVADFYFQPDFRDRVSNLESLLATAQSHPDAKLLVLYESAHEHALERLRARFRIDAELTLPVKEAELQALLADWREMRRAAGQRG
jgi:predicted RNase H-like nuclease (RuvC/YqgF family)